MTEPTSSEPSTTEASKTEPTGTAPSPEHHASPATESGGPATTDAEAAAELRDIADVAAVEIINSACVHLMSAAAVKVGLADDEETGNYQDLSEARKLITALAGLVTAAAPEIGNVHARSLRDGLRSLQLAFAEALPFPDPPGEAPGEKYTGRVS